MLNEGPFWRLIQSWSPSGLQDFWWRKPHKNDISSSTEEAAKVKTEPRGRTQREPKKPLMLSPTLATSVARSDFFGYLTWEGFKVTIPLHLLSSTFDTLFCHSWCIKSMSLQADSEMTWTQHFRCLLWGLANGLACSVQNVPQLFLKNSPRVAHWLDNLSNG